MIPIPHILGIGAVVAILAGAGGYIAGYSKATDKAVVEAREIEAKYQSSLLESITSNAALTIELEAKHHEAINIINAFVDHPVERVLIPFARCPVSQPDTSKGSGQPIDAARSLSEETGRILADDRRRTQRIVGDAELELATCRVVKHWAAALITSP